MNKTITVDSLRDLLSKSKDSSSNHLTAICPFCHDDEPKFFINKATQLWDCKKCGEKGNLFKLLKHLGRLDLITDGKIIELIDKLPPLFDDVIEDVAPERIEPADMPIGFKLLDYHPYADARGISDYNRYPLGTAIEPRFRNFLVLQVIEDNLPVAFLGRNLLPKSTIDRLNESYGQQGVNKRVLRWQNSADDFSKLVYGIDEITSNTRTVIVVESVFGKVSVDNFMGRNGVTDVVCVSVFGSKISHHQIVKLLLKGVENVVLMFDAEAVQKIKMYSHDLLCYFATVKIGIVRDGEDIDNFTDDDFERVLSSLVSVFEYSNSFIKCNLRL